MAKKSDDSVVSEAKSEVDLVAMKKQLDNVCATVRKIVAIGKKHFGKTFGDDSGRIAVAAVLSIALGVLTAVGIASARDVWSVGSTAIGTAKVTTADAGTATLTVDAISSSLSGAVAASTFTASGIMTVAPTTMNVTNGQTITVASSRIVLNGIGGAADSTNTIIFPAAAAAGQIVCVSVASSSTNCVLITDSAPVYSDGTAMGAGDGRLFWSQATNAWIQVGGSNN